MGMGREIVEEETGVVYDGSGKGWRRGGRLEVKTDTSGPSMTKQEFADECDINNIMSQYQRTGMVQHVNRYGGEYSDVTGAVSFHEAQNIVLAAQNAFMSVPSSVRTKFDNDPGKFLEFVNNPENRDEMKKLGLLKEDSNGTETQRPVVRSDNTGKPDGTVAGPAETGTTAGSDKR